MLSGLKGRWATHTPPVRVVWCWGLFITAGAPRCPTPARPYCFAVTDMTKRVWVPHLFGSGWFLIMHARLAYLSVLLVSSKSDSEGLMQLMSTVRLLPPRESCGRVWQRGGGRGLRVCSHRRGPVA